MELTLFVVFISIALLLVTLGYYRQEHTELVLIGFFFLFLLSFTLINGALEYQSGETALSQYTYGSDNVTITSISLQTNYTYSSFDDNTEAFNTNRAGYWLAIIAGLGFALTLFSIGKTNWRKQ